MNESVSIIGGGLVGSLLGCRLGQLGHQVAIYEKRGDPRKHEVAEGRSINLAMSLRGWEALEAAGLAAKVREFALPMHGRQLHQQNGSTAFQPYGKENQAIYSVSRHRLNQVLLEEADRHPNCQLHFYKSVEEIDLRNKEITFKTDGGEVYTQQYEMLVGADGAFSAVRWALQKSPRFNFSQHYLEQGYKELTIPATADGNFALRPDALHIWPRNMFMLIALPNPDKTFTATLFLDYEGAVSFSALQTEAEVTHFFVNFFPTAQAVMPDLLHEFAANPVGSLVTTRSNPWSYNNEVLLVGDAAHAIVPFYGQGMNAGFEDVRLLTEQLVQNGHDWSASISLFEQNRIPNAEAIADLAIGNFIEMRDRVADADFLLQKKMEAKLQDELPGVWVPQYSMVTFSHTPYATALARGKQQDALMQQLLKEDKVRQNWETIQLSGHPLIKNYLEQRETALIAD